MVRDNGTNLMLEVMPKRKIADQISLRKSCCLFVIGDSYDWR